MCWKVFHLCCFAVLVAIIKSIPYGTIVRLSCAACISNPKNCCIGTLVARDLAITTDYCAASCQYIVKNKSLIPILRTHSPSSDIYNINALRKINNIVLLVFQYNGTANRNLIKVSTVEPLSLIGLKAFVLILNDSNIFLRQIVVLPCEGKYKNLKQFFICTSKSFGERNIHLKRQGIPLLHNNCILGISGSNDVYETQDAFLAIAPISSWIEAIVNSLNKNVSSGQVCWKTTAAVKYTTLTETFNRYNGNTSGKDTRLIKSSNRVSFKIANIKIRKIYSSEQENLKAAIKESRQIESRSHRVRSLSSLKGNIKKTKNIVRYDQKSFKNAIKESRNILRDGVHLKMTRKTSNNVSAVYDDNYGSQNLSTVGVYSLEPNEHYLFFPGTNQIFEISSLLSTIRLETSTTPKTFKNIKDDINFLRISGDKNASSSTAIKETNQFSDVSISATFPVVKLITNQSTMIMSTSVMDWFRDKKATLNRKPPSVLILTTPSSFEEEVKNYITPESSIEIVNSFDPAPTKRTAFVDLT